MKVRGGIAGYFQHIGNVIALSRIVKSQDIHAEKRTPTEGFLRGDVVFEDGSRLHFRELVSTDPSVQLVSYTYQYMRADGTLIFRYDDSDHFLGLPTASTVPASQTASQNRPEGFEQATRICKSILRDGLAIKRLRQQTLEQPLDLPLRLPHPPPQRLDPRHHARKGRE